MRTPTVEEVKTEYLKFMDRQEHFQSLRKSIDDIRSNYDGNQSHVGAMKNGTYRGLRHVQSLDPNVTLHSQKSHRSTPPSIKSQKSIQSQRMQNSIYTIHTNFQNSQSQAKSNST